MSNVKTTVKVPSEFWSVKRYAVAVAVVLALVVGAFGAGYWLTGSEPASAAAVEGPVDVRAPAGDNDAVTQRLQNEGLVPVGPHQPSDTDAVTQRLQNEGLVPVGPRQPCDNNMMGGNGFQP
jgi:hypothetical protein